MPTVPEIDPDTLLQNLDRSIAIAEFSPEGDILRVNDNYLAIFGYTAADLHGQHHRIFCSKAQAASDAYAALWERLRSGARIEDRFQRQRSDGSDCWLEATYAPVHGADGSLQRLVKIATDVTERVQHEKANSDRARLLSLVADTTDSAVLITDEHFRTLYINKGFTRLFGWQPGEILGHSPLTFVVPGITDDYRRDFRATLKAGRSINAEELLRGKHDERYWTQLICNPIMDQRGHLLHTVTVVTDITQTKLHQMLQQHVIEAIVREHALADVMARICHEVERLAPDVSASILQVDEHNRLQPLAHPNMPEGYAASIAGIPIGPHAGACGIAAFTGRPVDTPDIAGDPRWSDYRHLMLPLGLSACWSTPIMSHTGRVLGTFALYYRHPRRHAPFHAQLVESCLHLCALALEREVSRARILQLAFYDSLTGLPNRKLLCDKAERALASASQQGDALAVLFVDLDRFKQINDSLGHPAGDRLLIKVAQRLQDELGPFDFAGRLSGDEFAVVLTRCDAPRAADTAKRMLARLGAPIRVGDTTLLPSASIGIALFPADGHDIETLLQRSDTAMDQAKTGSRGGFAFFDTDMTERARERLTLETALKLSLDTSGMKLHYQPQIDMQTGRLYGAEALSRWHHPIHGEISPGRFIPLAEECGLIGTLGLWAVREACRQLAQWRRDGLQVPGISVNLSPTNFHDLGLPRLLGDTLRAHGLQPQDLKLEITENVVVDTHPNTMQTIHAVHALGIQLAMDDFGTGYSSLGYLRRLPISELKVDRSFVRDLEHDETSRTLSAAVVRIGESLKLTVVAEGVESVQQCRLLREQGYHAVQGFLFSRALSADDFRDWLAAYPGLPDAMA